MKLLLSQHECRALQEALAAPLEVMRYAPKIECNIIPNRGGEIHVVAIGDEEYIAMMCCLESAMTESADMMYRVRYESNGNFDVTVAREMYRALDEDCTKLEHVYNLAMRRVVLK